MSERRKYNQSQINMFERCPRQWFYRYGEGLVRPPSAALTVGSAVDAGVTTNLQTKIDTGELASTEQVLDVFSTEFDKRASETQWGDDDPGEQKDLGAQLVSAHYLELAPKIDPVAVQQTFELTLANAPYDLFGTFDIIERSGVIVDTKTASKPYSVEKVNDEVQPVLYTFAQKALTGVEPAGFRFDVLIKSGKTKTQQVQDKVRPESTELLFDRINTMDRAIKAGVFPMSPTMQGNWWCSRKFCGYSDICPKFRGRK